MVFSATNISVRILNCTDDNSFPKDSLGIPFWGDERADCRKENEYAKKFFFRMYGLKSPKFRGGKIRNVKF